MDAGLIDKTCKQTPNYDVCVSTINSDPRSTGADVKGLGLIMVDAVKDKATGALNKADKLLKQCPGDQALLLHSCESGFSSSSPLVDNNKALLDVTAAAIARTLS
ncbi:hypothetical protein L3X38_002061 [Prunus dulcis]|uniref:Pectinesterase inhibitor domain-containing protein n=1 Tax=Prunus dulcis TaxID=3755 RepID=A0AAD4WUS7_PRUDU|nr:hypothetical protein L3X38_002061 [Prunus dulcis]